jgi:aspartyl-tRNA synthetase
MRANVTRTRALAGCVPPPGAVELLASEVTVLNTVSKPLPFPISESEAGAGPSAAEGQGAAAATADAAGAAAGAAGTREEVRLQHRVLDLR